MVLALFLSLIFNTSAETTSQEIKDSWDQAVTFTHEEANGHCPENFIAQELRCMQEMEKASPLFNPPDPEAGVPDNKRKTPKPKTNMRMQTQNTSKMIRLLSPYLLRAFANAHMNKQERAFFYSQMILESNGLTHLTNESGSFATPKPMTSKDAALFYSQTLPRPQGSAQDGSPLEPIPTNTSSLDSNESTSPESVALLQYMNTVGSDKNDKFIARGLLQIYGCDNYLSAVHYINLLQAGQEPYWQAYWPLAAKNSEDKDPKVKASCSKADIAEVAAYYPTKFPKVIARGETQAKLDPFNLLNNLKVFAIPNVLAGDPNTQRPLLTSRLIAEAGVGYWNGRCRSNLKPFADMSAASIINRIDTVAAKASLCVKGDSEALGSRTEYLKMAVNCMRDAPPIPPLGMASDRPIDPVTCKPL